MKSIARHLLYSACCPLALLAAATLNGQGITVLSRLGQTPVSAQPVAADSWAATLFRTGDDAWAYRLEEVTVLLQPAIGEVSSLSAVISMDDLPRLGQGTWLGPAVMGEGGRASFDGQGVLLKPGIYWLGLTAAQPIDQGAYQWSVGDGPGGTWVPGWADRAFAAQSADGREWRTMPRTGLQYAITVTPIPEPFSLVLLALGGVFLLASRRRRRPTR